MMKRLLAIGALLIVLGLAMLGIGAAHDGLQPIAVVHGQPIIANPTTKTQQVKPFSRLSVTANDMDVVVKTGAQYRVQVTSVGSGHVKQTVRSGQLKLTQKGKPIFGMMLGQTRAPQITITVPRDRAITAAAVHTSSGNLTYAVAKTTRLKLSATSGDMTVSHVQQAQLQLQSDSGNVRVTNATLHEPKVTTKYGDLFVTDSTINQGQFTLSSGDFHMTHTELKGKNQVNNTYGDNVVTDADKQSGYDLRTGSGDNKVFTHATTENNVTYNRRADTQLRLVTHNGDNQVK
ncbi:hypothetical protein FD51_GL000918 [Lacticaseibacillus zeae DSM 20178 = KCTC 3804]|uniref:DUF4097 domain-containing protein n=2 Tax=Lacticaseibacillus zeae TaxID=57037 RepID=A0A5R8LRV1_LACZE|nr:MULTISPECIES: DUF4097 family beta strand repeat-containing protein [Lacticaseibacillus]KRK11768.1 hypothetical protein FD51_GL000918 [Lacticaseibacillus zeae DSM 20178 = KCTC 3804]MDE3283392.1 DUF4097 domain-containing protein [Lacticaseibacillus casei]OLS04143.1 hypothetical protein AUQ39_14435 [Lacticaseibacillus casei]QVI31549.1 DUF4097 family beta strand repeat protein [Lacticaseibacillus zeae]TLF39888.1 DUF4097 domain-containing protein [Lacticaseibacillus zeae]